MPNPSAMLGRRVKPVLSPEGVVIRWEVNAPFDTCDTLVQYDDGRLCWHGCGTLQPVDGLGPLPDKLEAQKAIAAHDVAVLREVLDKFLTDEFGPDARKWHGCEHGKAFVGNAIVNAIKERECLK